MYAVTTIGELGTVPASLRPPPPQPSTTSAPLLAAVAIGGVFLGAVGLWAARKYL